MKIKFTIILILFLISYGYAKHPVKKQHIAPLASKSIDGIYKFTGMLNNRIPVFMWFVLKDSVLKGEVTYLKTAKKIPITIIGTITTDRGLQIFEFGKGGNITGIYNGTFNPKLLNGIWWTPGSAKELKYSLTPKDTSLNMIDKDFKPGVISGSYEYHYGKSGGDGGIDIKQIGNGDYIIEINCVTHSPENNIAEVEATKVHMVNNVIIYKVPDANCTYKIRVFNNFIVIDPTTELMNCGFGMNASIDGVFIKTK